jgi:hypothetical protein
MTVEQFKVLISDAGLTVKEALLLAQAAVLEARVTSGQSKSGADQC